MTSTIKEHLIAAHTPGPWEIGQRPDGSRWFSIGDPKKGPHYQADIYCGDGDARLIESAPDLLEALRGFVDGFDPAKPYDASDAVYVHFAEKAKVALAAIAKAEGRQP